jgi:hypothetical protein
MSIKKNLGRYVLILLASVTLVPLSIYIVGRIIIGPYDGDFLSFLGFIWLQVLNFDIVAISLLAAPYILWKLINAYKSADE